MSGGFFRGTTADQDTRFSNKKAKLLKSQKFASELEHLVDMAKVKMDVMKPWIAKRVTELIGFEDEVLINFIYGLLEGKEVNGKEIQISLTGFMERNTGKFMKELWSLLLSAQKNVSGVPQQFLDAKEEETKKKKAETDRITNEIQRKKDKEKQELELELEKDKMDGDGDISRYKNAGPELNSKHDSRSSSLQSADEKARRERNGRRGQSRVSQSPESADRSPSSSERRRSRSIFGSPPPRGRSISLERPHRSSPRQSGTPRRRLSPHHSPPPGYRSTRSGRQPTSRSRHRSPPPARYRVRSPLRRISRSPLRRTSRSPFHRRSRSPLRHTSRSPMWRRSRTPIRRSPVQYRSRSPVRRRSPSPVRRRKPSPLRQRSPSPLHRRSPYPPRRRSPYAPRRRSPYPPRRRSPSPVRRRHQRSPSTPRRQSISPIQRRFAVPRRSITPVKRRSPSVQECSSASPSSLSPVRRRSRKSQKSPLPSPREAIRPLVSLRSPQRDMLDRNDKHGRVLDLSPLHKSPSVTEVCGERSHNEQRRSSSPYRRRERIILPESPNPLPKGTGSKPHPDSSGTSADDREIGEHIYRSSEKNSPSHDRRKDSLGFADHVKSRKPHLTNSEKLPERVDRIINREQQESLPIHKGTVLREEGKESHVDDDSRAADKNRSLLDDTKGSDRYPELKVLPKVSRADELNAQSGSMGFDSEETDKHKTEVKEKRKHKKSERKEKESDGYSTYDSYDERKEAKRRKKEEKRLKKEERHRLREERHRRRKEKHAEKLKLKSLDTGSPSLDILRDHDRHASDDEGYRRRESRTSDVKEAESEQKKLEIELREKALESLRAKKGARN